VALHLHVLNCSSNIQLTDSFQASTMQPVRAAKACNLLAMAHLLQIRTPRFTWSQGCVIFAKSMWKVTVASFVVIWQNLSNHGLTRLKRFVSTFTDKLCN
jgi:hypothetical protein